jgi:hypothetical protein
MNIGRRPRRSTNAENSRKPEIVVLHRDEKRRCPREHAPVEVLQKEDERERREKTADVELRIDGSGLCLRLRALALQPDR